MDRSKVSDLLPRFLNAVKGLGESTEKRLRLRLACVVSEVVVFSDSEIPEELKEKYRDRTYAHNLMG